MPAISSILAGAAIVGSVGSAVAGASAANKASKAQQKATEADIAFQRETRDLNRADQAPYREAGYGSLKDLVAGVNDGSLVNEPDGSQFRADPGYEFSKEEGLRAAMRGVAAQGGIGSGGTLKSLTRYGQGMADQQYGQWYDRKRAVQGDKFNRLASIAGIGQTSVAQTAQSNLNTANNVGQAIQAGGNARASGYVGAANAISGGVSNLAMIAANAGGGGSVNQFGGPTPRWSY